MIPEHGIYDKPPWFEASEKRRIQALERFYRTLHCLPQLPESNRAWEPLDFPPWARCMHDNPQSSITANNGHNLFKVSVCFVFL
jgi:hypothetical protein